MMLTISLQGRRSFLTTFVSILFLGAILILSGCGGPGGGAPPAPPPDGNPGPQPGGITGNVILTGSLFAGIAIDGAGNVWIADVFNDSIIKLSSNGNILGTFSTGAGSGPAELSVDSGGNVWVANGGTTSLNNNNVMEFSSNGQVLGNFKLTDGATNLVISKAGNIWALNGTILNGGITDDAVSVLNSTGVFQARYDVGSRYTYGMALDGAGTAWFAHTNNTVTKMTEAGVIQATYNVGQNPNQTAVSPGLAIDSAGYIWVANPADDTVTRMTSGGVISGVFGVGRTPTQIAIDGAGNIWIVNRGDNTVTQLTSTGSFGGYCELDNTPDSVAIDRGGNLWVSGQKVVMFSAITTGPQFFPYQGPQFP